MLLALAAASRPLRVGGTAEGLPLVCDSPRPASLQGQGLPRAHLGQAPAAASTWTTRAPGAWAKEAPIVMSRGWWIEGRSVAP